MKSTSLNRFGSRLAVAFVIVVAVTAIVNLYAGSAPGFSRTVPLVRPDGTMVGTTGAKLAKGTVTLSIVGASQRFTVDAYNLASSYDKGLAVFVGDSPQMTNSTALQYVDLMAHSTNGHWHLSLESFSGTAPAQLGVPHLTNLVGLTIFVATETNAPILRADVLGLVADPARLSYKMRAPLNLPGMPLSLKAKGWILIQYNGKTGASVIDIKARGLNADNRYEENGSISNCLSQGMQAIGGRAHWRNDTGRGDELSTYETSNGVVYASDVWMTTAMDMAGQGVVIRDCYDGLHLWGIVPGP